MIILGTFCYGDEKQRVFQEALNGPDKKGREIPRVGERGSNGSSEFEICVEKRRFREIAQVFKLQGRPDVWWRFQ